MTETVGVIAALLSAISQATAHALLAAGRDKLVIRGLIGLTALVVAAPLTLFVPLPTGDLWLWLLASERAPRYLPAHADQGLRR
jgi:hypothetical protein